MFLIVGFEILAAITSIIENLAIPGREEVAVRDDDNLKRFNFTPHVRTLKLAEIKTDKFIIINKIF